MATPPIKPIAFYLPQFHPIPENDCWWGKGFTEWTNVRAARPQFTGHYQPHEPHPSIGWYDLRDRYFLRRQHAMAAQYGIYGFCYYYYWFNDHSLLETPLLRIRDDASITLPFCLCWANEAWTRAWYGQDKQVLLNNDYSESTMRGFMGSILPYLRHERYIQADNRPLLLVYRPEDIPNCSHWAEVWRDMAQQAGLAGLYLVGVEALTMGVPPQEYGFDATVRFAPDWSCVQRTQIAGNPQKCCDYPGTAAAMLHRPAASYTRYTTVFPSWDNSPRYHANSIAFLNANPGAFRRVMEVAIEEVRLAQRPEPFLFVNAWNEWGEGCHLEPDKKYGFAWLEAMQAALNTA